MSGLSGSCGWRHRKGKWRRELLDADGMMVCRECGRRFLPKHHNSRLCSPECLKAAKLRSGRVNRQRRREEEGRDVSRLKCVRCGKPIAWAKRTNARYCSYDCRRAAQWDRAAAKCGKTVPTAADRKAAKERKRLAKLGGLTHEEAEAIIRLQDSGDRLALWAASRKWSPTERRFAKKRYERKYLVGSSRAAF